MSKKLRDYSPALKYGAKITPQDIAGMIGLPYVGEIFYIDPTNGNDTSNSGKDQANAYKTLTQAESQMTAYSHDIVVLVSGGTAGTAEVANITWDKDYCHVIGNAAPVGISQRSRIVFTVDATDPCLTLSANGCIFSNVQIATWQDSNDVLVSWTGERNYFYNVHLAGMGTATAGDDATGRIISMSAAEENLLENCVIGIDTINRSAANASVELASASTRNIFRDCLFPMLADNAGALFVKAASSGDIDRFVLFQRCMFHNADKSTATTITAAMSIHASVGGSVILDGCSVNGATDWSTNYTAVMGANMPDITAANAGFMEQIAT